MPSEWRCSWFLATIGTLPVRVRIGWSKDKGMERSSWWNGSATDWVGLVRHVLSLFYYQRLKVTNCVNTRVKCCLSTTLSNTLLVDSEIIQDKKVKILHLKEEQWVRVWFKDRLISRPSVHSNEGSSNLQLRTFMFCTLATDHGLYTWSQIISQSIKLFCCLRPDLFEQMFWPLVKGKPYNRLKNPWRKWMKQLDFFSYFSTSQQVRYQTI